MVGILGMSIGRCGSGEEPMEQQNLSSELAGPKMAFETYVEKYHDIDLGQAQIIERPELHTPPYFGFVAVEGEGKDRKYVRGLASSDRVFTYQESEAFANYLKQIDFFHSKLVTAVQFIEIYRLLQKPDSNSYREDSWPVLYQQQLDVAPVSHLAEPIALPVVEQNGDLKLVKVWFQFEPGARYELWTFTVRPDNSFTLDRHPARYK
jgi:hypothetical protein